MSEAVAVALVGIAHAGLYLRDLQVVAHLHVLLDAHLLLVCGTATRGVVVAEGLGQGELDVLIEVEHIEWRHPIAMGCLVMDEECKGLFLVSPFEELYGMVGDEVRGVAFFLDILAAALLRAKPWVVVVALSWQDIVVVEAFRLA